MWDHRFGSQMDGGDDSIGLRVGKRGSMRRRLTKLIVQTFDIGGTRPVKLSRAAIVQHGCAKLEDLLQFAHELRGERLKTGDQEYGASERIQTFDIVLPFDGIQRPLLGLRRQPACEQRCRKKAEQGHNILRIRNREGSDRRQKVKIEGQHGCYRCHCSL